MPLHLLQLGQPVGVGFHLGLGLLGLRQLTGVFLGLTHEHTNLLREGISARAQVACFGYCGAVFRVKLQHLIDEGQLCVLKFLLDILTNGVGIVSYKLYVQHFSSPVFIV